jgi:hypothetical protein
LHVSVSGCVEAGAGALGDCRVDVDGDYGAGGADEFGDQGGVVATGSSVAYSGLLQSEV